MSRPSGTYRLQVRAEFGFADVAGLAGYLHRLGVSHAYLSPILQAVAGSAHGYDVIDHAQLSAQAGGRAGFEQMIAALHAVGVGAIADVVPNHMAVPTPARLNAPLWSVLSEGRHSPYAGWFDIDWAPGQVLMPVLGRPVGEVVAAGELSVDSSAGQPVLRYFDHEFPLRAGTEQLPIGELLSRQHYRLAWWRLGPEELNYRRFFDVTSLAAIRVEDAEVFAASHALLLELLAGGALDGLRIDHPDGLADPREYLRRLRAASPGAWVVVEKILEDGERLPADWACAGTTGYDALNAVQGLFVDPVGRTALNRLLVELELEQEDELDALIGAAKAQVVDSVLTAEVARLVRLLERICAADLDLRDHSRGALRRALGALLVSMDRYRAYAVPGEPVGPEPVAVLDAALARALASLAPTDEQGRAALPAIGALALETGSSDPLRAEFVVRFQQTCGPVMAKGIEDTAFYRWLRLLALNEVGASPHRFATSGPQFHAFAEDLQRDWPATMTTLSTHDTKRSEDARARLLAISELPAEWAGAVRDWTARSAAAEPGLPAGMAYLLWQVLVCTWTPQGPPAPERIVTYLLKAGREAKRWTTWTAPAEPLEHAVEVFARAVLADPELVTSIAAFVDLLAEADRVNVLGQKLIQLTMPGVPDVYQGCELIDRSLVDPDNRRPVDYPRRIALLARLEAGQRPASFAPHERLDAEKLLLTWRALRLRREHPGWFADGYWPLRSSSEHAVGFGRGSGERIESISLATRLGVSLARAGGWGEQAVQLPAGAWRDVLTGRAVAGGPASLAVLLADLPVALLTRV